MLGSDISAARHQTYRQCGSATTGQPVGKIVIGSLSDAFMH